MEARFLEAEPQSPKEEETTSIEARVERYAVNGTVATFVVRASSGPTERTLGVTYEQCRRLHERLRDDGGVLYAARDRFPKQIRGQRLGLRPTPRQAADQSQQLDAWLQFLTRRTDDLPLACQKAVRSFLELDKKGPWTTADRAPVQRGLFNRDSVTSQRRVYPLGDPQSLPVRKATSVSAMTWPRWFRRAVRNRHRHAIEQVSRRWRGCRRVDSHTGRCPASREEAAWTV